MIDVDELWAHAYLRPPVVNHVVCHSIESLRALLLPEPPVYNLLARSLLFGWPVVEDADLPVGTVSLVGRDGVVLLTYRQPVCVEDQACHMSSAVEITQT